MEAAKIIEEARRFCGTPFAHQGDVPGVGIDCVMLTVRVYQAAGVFPPDMPDPRPYPRGWWLERGDTRYRDAVAPYMTEVTGERPQPGDLLLYRIGRAAAHAAIVVAWPRVIHAVEDDVVREEDADRNALGGRPVLSAWRPRGATP